MAYEKRDMSGALFKNEARTKDTHSEYQGWVMVNGVEYWLNGWVKDGGKGKFFSLSLKPKSAAREPTQSGSEQTQNRQGGGRGADMDDSIPFAAEFR